MMNKVNKTLLVNDLRRNKLLNMTLFMFVLVSSLLMAMGVMTIERLTGSLDQIYEIAKPPHYMQMHVGDINKHQVETFVDKEEMVESYQIQDMVNIDGAFIEFQRQDHTLGSLNGSLLDNYFVVQNHKFDYLLNTNNEIVDIKDSEIGLPLLYARKHGLQVGDQIELLLTDETFTFEVTQILRDAQMGSSLASSIRFALSSNDYQAVKEKASNHESIISFRLNNLDRIDEFSGKYNLEENMMPKEGVGISLSLIKLVNSIGDGFMSGVIIFVGLSLMTIAIINMKFAIQSTIQEELREIGTLKAIGISHKDIKALYKSKYRVLTLSACMVSLLLAYIISPLFMENMTLNFGVSDYSILTFILPLLAVFLLYMLTMISINRVMKSIKKMSIVQVLASGEQVQGKKKVRRLKFVKTFNLTMFLHQYRSNLKTWSTYITACILCILSIILPLNLYMTLNSSDFISYIGIPDSHIRITLDNPSDFDQRNIIDDKLTTNNLVLDYKTFVKIRSQVFLEGMWINFDIDSGDYQNFNLQMLSGRLPKHPGEIAVSALNANRLMVSTGGRLDIKTNHEIVSYEIVGVYQDITNGGLTAKIYTEKGHLSKSYAYFITLSDPSKSQEFIVDWQDNFTDTKVLQVSELMNQTLGSITSSINTSIGLMIVLSFIIMTMVSLLFIILQVHKNRKEDKIMMAIGIESDEIKKMYTVKALVSLVIALFVSIALTYLVGEKVLSVILSLLGLGITQLSFIVHPIYLLVVVFIVPIILVFISSKWVSRRLDVNQRID